MKTKILPLFLTVTVAVGMIVGCKAGPTEEELAQAAAQEQFVTIKDASSQLQQMRADLEGAQAIIAEIEAVADRQRTDEQKAQLEEAIGQVENLKTSIEETNSGMQERLAEFLTVALNEFPAAPETAEALELYSLEAISVANEIVAKSGDYKKAIDHLQQPKSYYDAIEMEPHPELLAGIASLEDWRFVTEERFKELKKGMTMDEVKATIGVPYYGNIQEADDKGVESWLYKKREGGAAAVYFKTKTGKVYSWNFDAVKTKVVTD